jgi:hypothetical protein
VIWTKELPKSEDYDLYHSHKDLWEATGNWLKGINKVLSKHEKVLQELVKRIEKLEQSLQVQEDI